MSKFRSDECYKTQQSNDNKSIYGYVTNDNMFINNNSCFDVTPSFINYFPMGKPQQYVDIENELLGINRNNSKCSEKKYYPTFIPLNYNKTICKKTQQIRPNGYYLESNTLRGPLS
jgi:hypothetical protein